MLDTSGVQDNPYVVQHCAYRDRTLPYDAFLELNKYALWHLGVWDNKQLVFKPYDLTDYDWEIRTDDPGTTFSPQGPSTDSLFNGMEVTYTDPLTGAVDTLTPDTTRASRTRHRRTRGTRTASTGGTRSRSPRPCSPRKPLVLGQAALADRNRAEDAGDDHGPRLHPRPGRQPAARLEGPGGRHDRDHELQRPPRLIVETDYDDETKRSGSRSTSRSRCSTPTSTGRRTRCRPPGSRRRDRASGAPGDRQPPARVRGHPRRPAAPRRAREVRRDRRPDRRARSPRDQARSQALAVVDQPHVAAPDIARLRETRRIPADRDLRLREPGAPVGGIPTAAATSRCIEFATAIDPMHRSRSTMYSQTRSGCGLVTASPTWRAVSRT
jgi:hypothetical protein